MPFLAIFLLFITIFSTYSLGSNEIVLTYEGQEYSFVEPSFITEAGYEYSTYIIQKVSSSKYILHALLTDTPVEVSYNYNSVDGDYTITMIPSSPYERFCNVKYFSSVDALLSGFANADIDSYYLGGGSQFNLRFSSFDTFLNSVVFTSCGLYDEEGNELVSKPSNKPSFITTKDELSSGKFDTLKIDAGDFDTGEEDLILRISDVYDMGDGIMADYEYKLIPLHINSDYLKVENLNVFYFIPQSSLGIDVSNAKSYKFDLCNSSKTEFYDSVTFTIAGLTQDEEIENAEDEQTEAIKENTETNKGIWETLKEILSFLNPFSENFFVYKLIELLIEGIKSLFIPSDEFFGNYFSDLNDWFSDRLGFLYYPIELLIDILNRYLNLSSSNLSFTIPDIVEPFNNEVLIHSTTFDFNDVLENSVYKQVHDYYLIFVDFIIAFGLIKLATKKWEEVTSN